MYKSLNTTNRQVCREEQGLIPLLSVVSQTCGKTVTVTVTANKDRKIITALIANTCIVCTAATLHKTYSWDKHRKWENTHIYRKLVKLRVENVFKKSAVDKHLFVGTSWSENVITRFYEIWLFPLIWWILHLYLMSDFYEIHASAHWKKVWEQRLTVIFVASVCK